MAEVEYIGQILGELFELGEKPERGGMKAEQAPRMVDLSLTHRGWIRRQRGPGSSGPVRKMATWQTRWLFALAIR